MKIQNKSKYIIYNELEQLKNKQVKVNTTKHKNSKDWKCRRNKSGKCSVWIYVGSIDKWYGLLSMTVTELCGLSMAVDKRCK
jgi:hypothetical protein